MFHLLTVFINNAAEQEKYYLSNVLKKPQRVGVRQFVQCVKQLNIYIAQLPCWYYVESCIKLQQTILNQQTADLFVFLIHQSRAKAWALRRGHSVRSILN